VPGAWPADHRSGACARRPRRNHTGRPVGQGACVRQRDPGAETGVGCGVQDAHSRRHAEAVTAVASHRPGEAQFMAVRIGQMKETLAPYGITWRGVRSIAVRDDTGVQGVDIRHVEDDATPPCPVPLFRLDDEVQIAGSGPKTGEGCVLAATDEVETQRGVEANRTRHIMRRQCDRTDALDHRGDFIPGCRKGSPAERIHHDSDARRENLHTVARRHSAADA